MNTFWKLLQASVFMLMASTCSMAVLDNWKDPEAPQIFIVGMFMSYLISWGVMDICAKLSDWFRYRVVPVLFKMHQRKNRDRSSRAKARLTRELPDDRQGRQIEKRVR
jgi:hypothetical protein